MIHDYLKDLRSLQNKISETNREIKNTNLWIEILEYYYSHPNEKESYDLELTNILRNKTGLIFPYKQLKKTENKEAGYDGNFRLPYVLHEGKKMYFPRSWTVEQALNTYINFIENENIIGGNYREKSPHQYESKTFFVKKDDVIIDAGCAEALFSIHFVEKASKIYLIESDPLWIEPLKATFSPYEDKVKIINKFIAAEDSDTTISIQTLLNENKDLPLFIKMDIEGYETSVIESGKEALRDCNQDIRVACCTYHRHQDAEKLDKLFRSLNFETEFSDGYMLFIYDKLKPPYFRKGLIRAKKQKKA